jgi:hypothetical protein
MSAATTRSRLRECLDDVDFPADKATLLAAAERRSCDDDTIRALRSIPPETYAAFAEVLASVPLADDVMTDGERGAAHRVPAKPGVTERDRDVPPNPIAEELGENRKK